MAGWRHRRGRLIAAMLCAVVGLASLAAIAPARVDGPHEPNDIRKKATGPLRNNVTYKGAIERIYDPASGQPGDTDWFKLTASGHKPLVIAYTNLQGNQSCFGPEARLLTKEGRLIGTAQPPSEQTERITAHPQTKRKYYLRVRGYTIEPCSPDDSGFLFQTSGLINRH